MNIKELAEIVLIALHIEGEELEVVTTGHYGEPLGYSKDDFHVKTTGLDEELNHIKSKRVFNIEHKDIGPEPD